MGLEPQLFQLAVLGVVVVLLGLDAWVGNTHHLAAVEHFALLKWIGYAWSYLTLAIGELDPIWQPYIGSSFQLCWGGRGREHIEDLDHAVVVSHKQKGPKQTWIQRSTTVAQQSRDALGQCRQTRALLAPSLSR
jgi:hypothetical protein